jgi:hypothetical protein
VPAYRSCSRLKGRQQLHANGTAKRKCLQKADMLVLQLIVSILVRLLQAMLLLLHADTVLPRVFLEVLLEVCIYTSLLFVLAYLALLGVLRSKMRAGQQVRAKVGDGRPLCRVLSPLQMQLFDRALAFLFVGLGIVDGFYSGLRGIGTWWLTAAASSTVLYFYMQYLKGVAQVSVSVQTLQFLTRKPLQAAHCFTNAQKSRSIAVQDPCSYDASEHVQHSVVLHIGLMMCYCHACAPTHRLWQ